MFGSHGLHGPSTSALTQRHLSEPSLRSLGPPLPAASECGSAYGSQVLKGDGSQVFSQVSGGSVGVYEVSSAEIEHQMELAATAARESFLRRYPGPAPLTDSEEGSEEEAEEEEVVDEDGDGVEWRISDEDSEEEDLASDYDGIAEGIAKAHEHHDEGYAELLPGEVSGGRHCDKW